VSNSLTEIDKFIVYNLKVFLDFFMLVLTVVHEGLINCYKLTRGNTSFFILRSLTLTHHQNESASLSELLAITPYVLHVTHRYLYIENNKTNILTFDLLHTMNKSATYAQCGGFRRSSRRGERLKNLFLKDFCQRYFFNNS